MRLVGRRCWGLVFLAAAAAGCDGGGITEPEPSDPTFVQLQSDPGDWVGGGQSYEYTRADASVTVTAVAGRLSIRIDGDQNWTGDFQAPSSHSRLQRGTYSNLERYPFHNPFVGGMSWSGEGRGCNTLTGSFTIESVTYVGDVLTAIDLSFEQHCEGGAPALRGTIHWTADDETAPPGPVTPIPSGLWRPAPGSTPSTGNFVYLTSDAGDYIGAGQTLTYTGSAVAVSANGGHLSVNVNAAQWWSGNFQAMHTLTRLQPGYYGGLRRYPFHNPVKGGLDWSGDGRGCNTLTGWFAIDQVTYSGSTLTGIDLRFEQHCEGAGPALRGMVRWRQ